MGCAVARTHRKHASLSELSKRGGKTEEKRDRLLLKSHKQRRANERTKLRKEFL